MGSLGTLKSLTRWAVRAQFYAFEVVMQRILVSAWVVFVFAIVISIVAQAQESHPTYDTGGPIYDTTGPIYDNTLQPPAGSTPQIGRSINSLQAAQADLLRAPPDVAGRRERALAHVNAALEELRNIRKAGQ